MTNDPLPSLGKMNPVQCQQAWSQVRLPVTREPKILSVTPAMEPRVNVQCPSVPGSTEENGGDDLRAWVPNHPSQFPEVPFDCSQATCCHFSCHISAWWGAPCCPLALCLPLSAPGIGEQHHGLGLYPQACCMAKGLHSKGTDALLPWIPRLYSHAPASPQLLQLYLPSSCLTRKVACCSECILWTWGHFPCYIQLTFSLRFIANIIV